jgi:WD40 repeat protein
MKSWENPGRLLANIVSPNDAWLVRLLDQDRLLLTDRVTDQEIQLSPPIPGAYGATFSADGKHVAIASYLGLARVWETSTGREVGTFSGFQQGVQSAGFSPDGRRLATSSQGAEVLKLWDMESHQELLTLSARDQIFISTEFSPNGNLLGGLHYASALHLWRTPSWAEIAAVEAKENAVSR